MDRRTMTTRALRWSIKSPFSSLKPKRLVAGLAALNLLAPSLVGPLAPAYAQVITDPTAPIQFRPGVKSSGNGTPTVDIVRPSQGGVSHNKFREYNIDTRGLILNNSGLGGTSIIGGQVAKNPNLQPGGEARVILNEVTGTNRSNLNGVTEVFGKKADVIVANPNGIGCVGCGFINTGSATLTTGVPIVDYNAGTVGFETRRGEISISGAGVSAPAGQMPDRLNLIGRTLDVGGLVEAKDKASLTAGATRIDPATGVARRIAGAEPSGKSNAIVSDAAGVIRAASINVLSTDLDIGVALAGNLQALGSYDAEGRLVPGDLSIVSSGDLSLVSGETTGKAQVDAAGFFQLARDLSAVGEIAITAENISLLDSAGVHAGQDLTIVSQADIVSGAVLKSGGTLTAEAGSDASFSGLIAAVDGLDLTATAILSTSKATLIAPSIDLGADTVDLTETWVVPAEQATISGTNVTLGKDTAFDPEIGVNVEAAQRLTIGTLIDTSDYPTLALAFRDLAISKDGAFVSDDHTINAGVIDNAGVLLARGDTSLDAQTLHNAATGIIEAETIGIKTSGELTNLGQILSASTLAVLSEGNVLNDGTIGTDGVLTLQALTYTADAPEAELVAAKADLILEEGVSNTGTILSQGALKLEAGGLLTNAGGIRAGGNLNLTVADLINMGEDARIDSNAALTIRSAGMIDNRLGGILATGSLDLIAGTMLGNSGLLLSEVDASILAGSLDNRAGGKLHAGTINVDLSDGDLSNLGQIVSAGTLDVIRARNVLNNGIVQAGSSLHLEALSYTANSPEAELVAENADLMLDGALENAGLIAAASSLTLDVRNDLQNATTGEIAAQALETNVVGDLANLGKILSETTLQATVSGLLFNGGAIRSGDTLSLTAADLVNSGAETVIDSKADLIVQASGRIDNLAGNIFATDGFDLIAGTTLTNSGVLYSEQGAFIQASALDNLTSGQLHAGTINLDLAGGELANLGQIVSRGSLDVIKAGDVLNDGIVQANGALRLEALSYTANAVQAELVAANADLILDGALKNAGLIAVANNLGLGAKSLSNAASGGIVAKALEAKVAGDLTNLGSLMSEETLLATVGGLLANSGGIRAGQNLNLTVADLTNTGSQALIAGNGDVAITSSRGIGNLSGGIAAGSDLTLVAASALTNSGVLEGGNRLSLTARILDNQASGRIHAGSISNTANGILHAGSLTIDLSRSLANLGEIVSANALSITSGRTVNNTGSIEAGGDLRLEAHAYVPGSAAARLAAYNLDLILGSSLTNSGQLAVAGRLGLDIDGSLTNTKTGRIEAGAIEMAITQNLTNLGSIVSEGALKAVVAGLLTNEGTIRSGGSMTLKAGSLVNRGEDALIGADGDLSIQVAGKLDNLLGRILAEGSLGIEAGGTLTNASARIESGADMMIAAATVINTAIAGTDGGTIDFHELGELTVDYEYDHDDHPFSEDYNETRITAVQDEFSRMIELDKPGVIRSGRDLILESDRLHNENGRILAVNDLSIDTRVLVNDAQTYTVDHYKLEWGQETQDDYRPFTAPAGGGWEVLNWQPNALSEEAYTSIVDSLPRETVTRVEWHFVSVLPPLFSDAVYLEDGPNGPGYYEKEVTTYEAVVLERRTVLFGTDGWDTDDPHVITDALGFTQMLVYTEEELYTPEGRMALFASLGSLLISTGDAPVSIRQDDMSHEAAVGHARLKIFDNANPAEFLNLEALGIDPNDVPETIVLSSRIADLGEDPYDFEGKERVGEATVAQGSVIKSGNALVVSSDETTNRGTMEGRLVSIEGGTLDNGIGTIDGVDGSGFGRFDRAGLGGVTGEGGSGVGIDPSRSGVTLGEGSGLALAGGGAGIVDFVLDDVAVPPLDLGAFNERNLVSLDPNEFGNLQKFTGSLEAARLLAGAGNVTGSKLSFYGDPVQEAKALAEAALRATGSHLVIDPSLSAEEQREQLYRNAAAFAESTGAEYGVALTEAQRAALTQPIVWHETRIIDGKPVLVPRLYLPSSDELLRGGRGPGLIAADDLLVDLSGRLSNTGTLAASGLASISASAVINQRMIDLDMRERAYAGGRGDTGLITAGTLLMTTDRDLVNRGGTITSAGALDLRLGGSLINETQRYTRAVDGFDQCLGDACGGDAVDYNIAKITAGRDLTVIAGKDLVNKGGELGSVTDMLLAAGGDVRFETLKDSFVSKDFHQRGFLSGTDIVEHTITTAEATAQSLVGDVSILAGYGVCNGGTLCAGNSKGDAVLNGALVSAYGDVSIDATGAIDMGVVSEEVHNTYKDWGFKGLGWGKVKQSWNDVSTSVTRISGDNVALNAKGPITGTGTKIAAASDLLMMTDSDIRFQAAQDARYFTEKGFYIGLTFPGSAGINAALQGGSGSEVLTGLADINPLTRTLARLANADNGLAAGLAAVDLVTGGASLFGKSVPELKNLSIDGGMAGVGKALGDQLNPLAEFTDENGNFSFRNFGISISSWENEQRWSESQIAELVAGDDVVMKAGLDVILDQGTKLVAGDDVSIDAGRDIILAALVDYAKDKSSSFGLNLSFSSIGFDVAKSEGYDEVLTNASITAGGDVSLKSGRDTALLGGNITGRSVDLEVGRDLTILSPQAEGWRDGYSFGLTIGVDLTSFGIRGSSENGSKAWSSGSSIIAVEGIDITVGEDTVLVGALLNATDGDINLETETLTVSDNKDHDQYRNVGGSIGFDSGGTDRVGFSYEEKDKRGETRTTLDAAGDLNVTVHDADDDGVRDTIADREAAGEQIAEINRDAANWQEITRDSHTKLSGELNVTDLRAFGDNVKAIQNYNRVMNEPLPDGVAAEGPEHVDYYRRLRANGLPPVQAQKLLKTPELQSALSVLKNVNEATEKYGSRSNIPKTTLALIIAGYDFDAVSEGVSVGGCDTAGNCYVVFKDRDPKEVAALAKNSFIEASERYQNLVSKYNAGTLTAAEQQLFNASVGQMRDSFKVYALCNFLTTDPQASAQSAYLDLVPYIGEEQHQVGWFGLGSFSGVLVNEARGLVKAANVVSNAAALGDFANPLLQAMDAVDMAMLSAGIAPGSLAAKGGKFAVTPAVKGAAWFKTLAQKYGDDLAQRMAAAYGPKSLENAVASGNWRAIDELADAGSTKVIATNRGFDDLAKFRQDLGLPPAGAVGDKSTLAVVEVNSQKIYGINAHGQPVAGVNVISSTHAEIDALNQIKQQGIDVSGQNLILYVDRTPCAACGQNGGIRSMVEQLGLNQLTVIGPDGPMIITPR